MLGQLGLTVDINLHIYGVHCPSKLDRHLNRRCLALLPLTLRLLVYRLAVYVPALGQVIAALNLAKAIAKMKLKVRDSEHELKLRELKVSPEFVKVTLKPTASVATSGLYDLIVEIPRDTEPCGFRGDNMGKIHFAFDHPRIPKLDLLVDFSVRPPEELR